MKNLTKTLALLFSILLLFACNKSEELKDNPEQLLLKTWVHSLEEETQKNLHIFRPSDFKEFPPTWFRQTFTLRNDKTCQYLVLAPNDGHYFEEGFWVYEDSSKSLKIFDKNHKAVLHYTIMYLDNELMELVLHETI